MIIFYEGDTFLFFGLRNYKIFSIKYDCAKLVLLLNDCKRTQDNKRSGQISISGSSHHYYLSAYCLRWEVSFQHGNYKKDQQVHLELFGINSCICLIGEGLKNPSFPLRNLPQPTDPPPPNPLPSFHTFRKKSSHFLVHRI